jgi:hypothetical protein
MSLSNPPENPPQYSISEILVKLGSGAFNHGVHCEAQRIVDEEPRLSELREQAEQAINQLIYTQVLEELESIRAMIDNLEIGNLFVPTNDSKSLTLTEPLSELGIFINHLEQYLINRIAEYKAKYIGVSE